MPARLLRAAITSVTSFHGAIHQRLIASGVWTKTAARGVFDVDMKDERESRRVHGSDRVMVADAWLLKFSPAIRPIYICSRVHNGLFTVLVYLKVWSQSPCNESAKMSTQSPLTSVGLTSVSLL